jgi:hypothetical protein
MTTYNKNVLLVGASYTALKLLDLVESERNDSIRFTILTRDLNKVALLKERGYEAIACDLTAPQDYGYIASFLPNPIDFVVDSVPPMGEECLTTNSLISIIKERREEIQGIIYLSSTGVYGRKNGEAVTEESELLANNPQSKARVFAEKLYSSLDFSKTTILRLAAISSEDRGLITSLKQNRFKLCSGRYSNRIHVLDIAATILQLLNTSVAAWPAVLNLSDNEPALIEEVVEYYCKKLGLPFPAEISRSELEAKGHYTLTSNQKVINKKLIEFLGRELQYPNYRSYLTSNK